MTIMIRYTGYISVNNAKCIKWRASLTTATSACHMNVNKTAQRIYSVPVSVRILHLWILQTPRNAVENAPIELVELVGRWFGNELFQSQRNQTLVYEIDDTFIKPIFCRVTRRVKLFDLKKSVSALALLSLYIICKQLTSNTLSVG